MSALDPHCGLTRPHHRPVISLWWIPAMAIACGVYALGSSVTPQPSEKASKQASSMPNDRALPGDPQ
jgi:hypothetical protein